MNIIFEHSFSNDSNNKDTEKNRIEPFINEINKKLDLYLKSIVQTNLFISEYFDSIINEIDYETESVLLNLDKIYYHHSEDELNSDEKNNKLFRIDFSNEIHELNRTRNSMIKILREHEGKCFKNENTRSDPRRLECKSKYTSLKCLLDKIVARSKRKQSTYKKLYYFNRKLDHELYEISKEIFLNRTLFYIPNRNKFDTKLLTIKEEIDVECLKNNDASYFLKQKSIKSFPKSIGYLVSIDDLFLTIDEIDIIKYLNDHLVDFRNDFLNKRNQATYRLFKDLKDYIQNDSTPTKLELKLKYFFILNMIESLYLSPKQKIIELHLEQLLADLNKINKINISYISYFHHIETNFFQPFSNLTSIDMSHCGIKRIASNQFLTLNSLLDLDLSSNIIKYIDRETFKGLFSLLKLNLSSNQLESLIGYQFADLNNLEELKLFYNRLNSIESLAFRSLKSLKKLYLSGNRLESVDDHLFSSLDNLVELDLSFNNISQLTVESFSGLAELKRLNLNKNNLQRLIANQFLHLKNLEELVLYNNKLNDIESNSFKSLANLRKLNLLGNSLRKLHDYEFEGLSSLAELNLNRNQICEIAQKSFVGLDSLRKLLIEFNKLDKPFIKRNYDLLDRLEDLKITCENQIA